ncbi:MAG: redoxin domain-containing protein [Flavobacteriaceae bacterium]|nr:redoxin domain-containing protein [Bacteroidia bacterium]NNF74378.1 redoxin domain-containing protein [Flavobacteriaceae bacterium]
MIRKFLHLALLFPLLISGQQALNGTFLPPEEFDWVLVYKVSPTNSSYVGDAKIDENGKMTFVLDSTQTKGMYRLVYAVPQEEYNFDIIYDGNENVEFTFHIDQGIEFESSIENKLMSSYTNSMSLISQSLGNYFREQSSDTTALMTIFKTQRETQTEFEKLSKDMIAGHFVRANRPYIPDSYEDLKTYLSNIKNHYFDHVDFTDPILQSSNFLVEQSLNYVFGMVSKDNLRSKGYEENLDKVVNAMEKATDQTKKMLLEILWQQLSEANYESTANYLADNYLIDLAKSLQEQDLVNELVQFKNVSLGHIAPNFKIDSHWKGKPVKTNFHDLKDADQYILVFWSSNCSHCLEELPKLRDFMKSSGLNKTQVIAFALEDELSIWTSEKFNYPDFIHVAGLDKWENAVGKSYNISATPTYFILDGSKSIIAKPEDIVAVKQFFQSQK